ncbi:hypothetical protein [Alysiella crassa]|uniref:Uncharacterized protein n=1 Tax=Alysiella crassa TaxID=153491 RepID=A0A376BWA0_9NEIS|nr:hypothetical protein [Alysiella crassa]UOP06540.1 hypothetical protein LVJ80_12390 [Alysiella crassa]SSY81073.1 Uncharacterised protein [Alysiella crassa]
MKHSDNEGYTSCMRWASAETDDKWVWRHETDQSTPFEEWKRRKDEADKAWRESYRKTQKSKHEAHVIAYHRHRAYGHLPQRESMSLADALKLITEKFGRAV